MKSVEKRRKGLEKTRRDKFDMMMAQLLKVLDDHEALIELDLQQLDLGPSAFTLLGKLLSKVKHL